MIVFEELVDLKDIINELKVEIEELKYLNRVLSYKLSGTPDF